MTWIDCLLEYVDYNTVGKCPFCGSERVQVTEHVNGKRKSVTFLCEQCKKSDHFDGVDKGDSLQSLIEDEEKRFREKIRNAVEQNARAHPIPIRLSKEPKR